MKSYQISFLIQTGRAEEAYKALVIEKKKRKYDINDELAINRKFLKNPEKYAEEYDEYSAYLEQCKAEARAEINAKHTVPVNRVYVPAPREK